jgi:hypothetical protein
VKKAERGSAAVKTGSKGVKEGKCRSCAACHSWVEGLLLCQICNSPVRSRISLHLNAHCRPPTGRRDLCSIFLPSLSPPAGTAHHSLGGFVAQ